MSIDLHTHSSTSDGTMTPGDLVTFACKKGLKAIALTDHDTIDGVEEAVAVGENLGVEVIPGVELSVKYFDHNVHLLGYLFDYRHEGLRRGLERLQAGRKMRNRKIIEKLNTLGFTIAHTELQQVAGFGPSGRPHIARLMMDKKIVGSMDEAFEKYLGQSGIAYVTRFLFGVQEAIALIKSAGGLAVLAHPLQLKNSVENFSFLLHKFKDMGLDGIEVYYPNHSRKFKKQLMKLADDLSLVMTGGSDFHGSIRPGTTLAGGKNVSVPLILLDQMKERAAIKNNLYTTQTSN